MSPPLLHRLSLARARSRVGHQPGIEEPGDAVAVGDGAPVDVKRVSRELGVRYVLEGSVRRAGRQLRITAQLVTP